MDNLRDKRVEVIFCIRLFQHHENFNLPEILPMQCQMEVWLSHTQVLEHGHLLWNLLEIEILIPQ